MYILKYKRQKLAWLLLLSSHLQVWREIQISSSCCWEENWSRFAQNPGSMAATSNWRKTARPFRMSRKKHSSKTTPVSVTSVPTLLYMFVYLHAQRSIQPAIVFHISRTGIQSVAGPCTSSVFHLNYFMRFYEILWDYFNRWEHLPFWPAGRSSIILSAKSSPFRS